MEDQAYSEIVFKKTFESITVDDLKEFFKTEQEETGTIEFKSGDVSLEEVFKEIAAFLNTEGGLLFIGAPRENRRKIKNHEVIFCAGELTYSKFRNKDWLLQKISTNIFPVNTSIWVREFISEAGSVFLVDVPQSINPPHQVSEDGRYYIRMDRRAVPAPHGLVQALFNKRKFPDLKIELMPRPLSESTDIIEITILNKSSTPADKICLMYEIYGVQNANDHTGLCESMRERDMGIKFLGNYINDIILPQNVLLSKILTIGHHGIKYLMRFTLWSRDVDSKVFLVTYNPIDGSMEEVTVNQAETLNGLTKLWGLNKV